LKDSRDEPLKDVLLGLQSFLNIREAIKSLHKAYLATGGSGITLEDLFSVLEELLEEIFYILRTYERIPYIQKKNPEFVRFDSDRRPFERPAFDHYEKKPKFQDAYAESFKQQGLQPSTLSKRSTEKNKILEEGERNTIERLLDSIQVDVGNLLAYIRLEKRIPTEWDIQRKQRLLTGDTGPKISKDPTDSRDSPVSKRIFYNRRQRGRRLKRGKDTKGKR
jgi:hypothetical protein